VYYIAARGAKDIGIVMETYIDIQKIMTSSKKRCFLLWNTVNS